MSNEKQKRLAQFDEMLELGKTILQTKHSRSMGYLGSYEAVEESKAKHWGIKCLSLLEDVFGEASLQYKEFIDLFEGFGSIQGYVNAKNASAVLQAAKELYEEGNARKRTIPRVTTADSGDAVEHLITGIESEAKRNTRIYLIIISLPVLVISSTFFYYFEIKYASVFTIGIIVVSYILSILFLREITPTKLHERIHEYEQNRLRKKFGFDK